MNPRAATRPVLTAAGLGLAGVATTVVAAALTGGAAPDLLSDPGPLVRWGVLLTRSAADLLAALTVGVLLLAALVLPVGAGGQRANRSPDAHPAALRLAAAAAAGWAVAGLALTVLEYADIAGRPLGAAGFGEGLLVFVRDFDPGRQLGLTVLGAATIAVLAAGVVSLRAAGLLAGLAVATQVPRILGGHAAGSTDHEIAVNALGVHVLSVSAWAGGLAALVLLARGLSTPELATAAHRFSRVAGWAAAGVALSGVLSGLLRLGGWSGLATGYAALLGVKAVALVALLVAGRQQRRTVLPRLAGGHRAAFRRLAGTEVAVMVVAIGVAAALATTVPPTPEAPTGAISPAQSLTGYPLPPAPSATSWLTQWRPDLLWLLVVAALAGLYLGGLRRLRLRGDPWPVHRTACWFAGLAVLVYVTCGAPAVYGRVAFSWHMIDHMTLSMVAPPLLALAAPVTLALRTLRPRRDGSRGPREWMLAVLGSRSLAVLSFAPVAAVLFTGSLVAFYYTDLFRLALSTHAGHELMNAHFLIAGYLFAWVLIGPDPGPHRPGHPIRLLLLFATMAFHALFGVVLYGGSTLLQPRFFTGLGRTWSPDLLADQRLGGGLMWALGELPTLGLALVLAVQWSRSDSRETRRLDRAADRDGGAELAAYNAMLARLARHDAAAGAGGRDSKG